MQGVNRAEKTALTDQNLQINVHYIWLLYVGKVKTRQRNIFYLMTWEPALHFKSACQKKNHLLFLQYDTWCVFYSMYYVNAAHFLFGYFHPRFSACVQQ